MIYTEEQLKGLQKIAVDILKAFIEVCDKLNLQYFIWGGTLLGAVRHQGFIPWDDDIDVAMPRADYEVFLEKGQALMPENYFLQHYKSNKACPYNYCRICDINTTFLEKSSVKIKLKHGVKIDVFPLDFYPDDKKEIKKFKFKNNCLKFIAKKRYRIGEGNRLKVLLKNTAIFMIEVLTFFIPYSWAVKKRDKLFTSFKEGKNLVSYSGIYREKEIFPKEWCSSAVKLQFEGLEVDAPIKYHELLTHVYGDYMTLPPEEKRVGHHYTKVLDLTKSYTNYI